MILNMFISMMIILPKAVAELYGSMGWVAIAVATVIIGIYSRFIVKISRLNGTKPFVKSICDLVSKPIGGIILLLFFVRFAVGAGLQLRIFSEVVARNILSHTPVWMISLFFVFACLYAVSGGYEVRARLAEILVSLVVIFAVLIFIFSLEQMDFTQIFINKGYSGKGLSLGIMYSVFAFQGLELLLFATPYVSRKNNISNEVWKAVMFIGVLSTVAVLISTAYFGVEGVKDRFIAVIDTMNTVDFRFSFGQKQDIVVMGIWIASMFGAISSLIYFGNSIVNKVCKKNIITLLFIVAVVMGVSVFPKNMTDVYYYYDIYIKISGTIFLIAIPVLIYIAGLLKGRRGIKNEG